MKAILFVAVLAFVANAHLGTPAYHLGFSEQLGLNNQQLEHASACFNSFKAVLADLNKIIIGKNENFSTVVKTFLDVAESIEGRVQSDCSLYLHDLASVILRNTNGDIKGTVLRNLNKYSFELIQQFTLWLRALAAGDHYRAGHIEAYIFQVLFSIETPKVLPLAEVDVNKFVTLNLTKYTREFAGSFFSTLHFNDSKIVDDFAKCNLFIPEFVENINILTYKLQYASETIDNIKIIEVLINNFVKLYGSCIDYYTFAWKNINSPLWEGFKQFPIHNMLIVIHNVALNLPELRQSHVQMVVDIIEGRYAEAGKINANMLLTILENYRLFF